jgi:hypothetical protein
MRVGFNPNKDKILSKSDFTHQVIVPVYIPHQNDYFKDCFQILRYCLESLITTSHAKTYITVVNNGSCDEVILYLNQLQKEGKIHEVIHTTAIGKLNAILKGVTGHQFSLITISDADVLFLNNWQKATYEVFEAFPKAGVVSTTPSSKMLKQYTSNVIISNLFSKKLKFTRVLNPKAMLMFAESIGNKDFYKSGHLKKYLTISNNNNFKAVIGAGHFLATYKGSVFDSLKERYTPFALGGTSEDLFLDKPVNDFGYWRLSTIDNYTYHMGNLKENWMQKIFESITDNSKLEVIKLRFEKKHSFFGVYYKNILFKLILIKPFWKLFLQYKGLSKEEIKMY